MNTTTNLEFVQIVPCELYKTNKLKTLKPAFKFCPVLESFSSIIKILLFN